ncbi:peroxide stress protein YaaA [Vaginella massiliensis]|uniref:peroxide stress protein YaaA n=1 Tax=Vaginella massiliensis TaxID=1816680 RepID=UPI0037515BB7
MKLFISPAKLMDLKHETSWNKNTKPQFLEISNQIMDVLKDFKPNDLKSLMKVSPEIAELNVERNMHWNDHPKAKDSLNAILAFKGEVYRGIAAEELSDQAKEYLNANLFILSGLYGILRPSDRIMPYRLEMGTKLAVQHHKNLYELWKENLTEYINSKTKKNEILLNLASNEYIKSIDRKLLKGKLIEVDFLDYKNGDLKKIMMYFKHARGEMARWIAENNIQTLEELQSFDGMGYRYDSQMSDEQKLTFTR